LPPQLHHVRFWPEEVFEVHTRKANCIIRVERIPTKSVIADKLGINSLFGSESMESGYEPEVWASRAGRDGKPTRPRVRVTTHKEKDGQS
jgi:hypothetical protein